ncbi:hypothetical protein ACP70R_022817 [Stipagrostis hirtigluma subsp. patula]
MALHDSTDDDGGDRLSNLPDHVLVLVLARLRDDVRLLARTCVLSKRWRTLPLMLPRLEIGVKSFLPASPDGTLPMRCLRQATSRFADALRFFLDAPAAGQRDIRTLRLVFTLTKHHHHLHEIGRLVSAAVARGEVRELEVVLRTVEETESIRVTPGDAVARGYARRFMRLFRAAPAGVLGSSLRRLALRNLCFRRASELEGVVAACEALETLHLNYCWPASWSALRIDAPRSRLRELRLRECYVERVDLVRAPELVELCCETWFSESCPVTFAPGAAPSLKRMALVNTAAPGQLSFKLSELLENASPLESLHLDFGTYKIWVQPESRTSLGAAFSKLKEIRVRKIFPDSDISWTMFLLQAAPVLEFLDIHVSHDPLCTGAGDGWEVEDLEWEVPDHFEHHHLRTVKIHGSIDAEDLRFARLVMKCAVNLKLLLLNARITCDNCIAARQLDPSFVLSSFPEDKDGVDAFVRQLKEGIPTSARILVRSVSNEEFEY